MSEERDTTDYLSMGQKIPRKEKWCFGFGVLAGTILTGISGLYLTDYYINRIKITYEFFIIANVIFMVYNAFNDIFFGHYADNVKHKLGRRIPFIRYGAPFFALSFIYFWFPIPGSYPGDLHRGQALKFFQLLSAYLFFDTMLTIVILSVVALPPEMSESTEERTSIAVYNTIFGGIGGASVILVPMVMSLGLDVFRLFIIIMALIAMCAYLILSYGVKERKDLTKALSEQSSKGNIIKEIGKALKNKAFISFLLFNFCVVYMMTMFNAFGPFLVNIFGLESEDVMIVLLAFYSGFILAIPIFFYLGTKVVMRTIILITSTICLVGIVFLSLIDLLFHFNVVYWIIFSLDGILASMVMFYYPFISDALDIDELNTGRRREGVHFGINAIFAKPAEQLPVIIGATILLFTSYIQGGRFSDQPESAIFGLKFMVTVIPMILLGLIILSQIFNPLKGEYLKDMKLNILDLHEKKSRKSNEIN